MTLNDITAVTIPPNQQPEQGSDDKLTFEPQRHQRI